MTIKLEKIINDETPKICYRIKKSFFSSLLLTEEELKKLEKLIRRELGEHKLLKVK